MKIVTLIPLYSSIKIKLMEVNYIDLSLLRNVQTDCEAQ